MTDLEVFQNSPHLHNLNEDLAALDSISCAYDIDYIENMLRMYAKSSEDISNRRWDFIKDYDIGTVLDYGSGCGFFRAWRPKGVEVDSFDICKAAMQTGIMRREYDLVCFFDVLEHLDGFGQIANILMNAQFIYLTVPVKPDTISLKDWRHFKPGEHLHNFTEESIEVMLGKYGFELIKKGKPECPPRVDVLSFLFARD